VSKKYTVLVTSAVYTNYGIYTPQQRIQQTLETVKSAKKYIPNSTIILIDNSKVDVQTDTSAELNELIDLVDYYIDNSDDEDIKHFHNNVTNYDVGKNAMECLGMLKALSYISNDPEIMTVITESSKIFKLSGRYTVTENFDIEKFDNDLTEGKYVFKRPVPGWIPANDIGVAELYQTRLWAFSPSLFLDTIGLFNAIIRNMFELFNQQKYIDVEHSMAKFLPKDRLVELDRVGLTGSIAPNGMVIED
jgi:hypothetical protein